MRVASAKGRRRALGGWRDSRCGSEGDGRAGGVFVARTDVGGPAFAGVLVEEGDGWGGGIHGGCVSRVRSHCRAGRDENHESNAPSIRLPFSGRAENVRTLGADETAPLLDGTCHSYDTQARMCIEPLDTSECTRAMPRGASVGDEDGYAGIARARHETPAAWTHLPAERRSDIDVGVSEGTRASDGRTPVPATPASPKRADRLIPLASAPKTVGAASNGVAARKPGKKRGRGKRSVAKGKPTKDIDARIGRLLRIAVDGEGEPLTAPLDTDDTPWRWQAGIVTECHVFDGERLYFVYKGQFKDWYSAAEVLDQNEEAGVPSPHFPDYLDIIELEGRGLVEYLDLHMEPHPRSPEPPGREPDSGGLDILAEATKQMKAGGSAATPEASGDRPASGSAFLSGLIGSEGFVTARKKPRPARGRNLRFEDEDNDEADVANVAADQPPTTPAGIVRTEPDGAWTEAARLMNELRGGEESMETLGRALEEKTPGGTAARAWREVSSPPPPPTCEAEAVRSASPAEAPRSATPARLRLETPLGKVLGGMDANLCRKSPQFLPMDDDVEEEPPRDHGEEEGPGGEEAPGEDAEAPLGFRFEYVESPRDDVDEEEEEDTEEKKETEEEENGEENEEKCGDGEERKVSEADTPTPEPDAAAAILAEAVAALIARIESNAATRASLMTRADAIDAQNEELGRTIKAMTAAIDTLTGKN